MLRHAISFLMSHRTCTCFDSHLESMLILITSINLFIYQIEERIKNRINKHKKDQEKREFLEARAFVVKIISKRN